MDPKEGSGMKLAGSPPANSSGIASTIDGPGPEVVEMQGAGGSRWRTSSQFFVRRTAGESKESWVRFFGARGAARQRPPMLKRSQNPALTAGHRAPMFLVTYSTASCSGRNPHPFRKDLS